jgi:uncharacterized protein (TIGR01244 family)
MRSFRIAILLAVAVPCTAVAQHFVGSTGSVKLAAPVKLDTTGMFLSTFVSDGDDMFIGGQPTEKALRDLKARGVTMVINLRTPEEMQKSVSFDEAGLIKSLGMQYVHIPMRGNAEFPYSPETLAKFSNALKSANGKVLVHCTVAWRASHIWAAYLIKERGVADADALSHARAINLMDDHHMTEGAQPVEEFLGRKVSGLAR